MWLVTVVCSATHCRFKKNDAYYSVCHNPQVRSEYEILGNGHVDLSGCKCAGCGKEDCIYKEYEVKEEKEDGTKDEDQTVSSGQTSLDSESG